MRPLRGDEEGRVMEGLDPRGYYVYLLWAHRQASAPLYVGSSENLLGRLGAHMTEPGRRRRVRWVTFIRCESKREMEETEARLIAVYQPELNTVGRSPLMPMTADERDLYVTTTEAGRWLNRSAIYARGLVKQGVLPAVLRQVPGSPQGKWFIRKTDLAAYVSRLEKQRRSG